MPKTTNYDFLVFFYCVIAGVALSILCDIFRGFRKYLKMGAVSSFITDLLFFIIAAFATFYMQFVYSNGLIRWYVLGGELAGFMSARAALSPLLNRLFKAINSLLRLIFKPVFAVIKRLFGLLEKLFGIILKFGGKISKNILKWLHKMMYNIKRIFEFKLRRADEGKRKNGKVKAQGQTE